MDKIYKLLPWLNAEQAVDWLCGLTDTQMTEELLISLCDAGHAQVFIDVGRSCQGLDDGDWVSEVIASGKQMVVDPSILNKPSSSHSYMVLRGDVLDLRDIQPGRRQNIDWFPSSPPAIFLCFKQADVLALADKINSDDAAEKADLIAQSERNRKEREQALHALHEAQENIIALEDKLQQALASHADAGLSATSKKSHLLAIGGLLRLVKDTDRPRYNQSSAVNTIAAMGWTGAGSSNLNHIFAEANIAAKDAESEVLAKLEARDMAMKQSSEA
ncbi:hypothetical protein [Pseudomonas baltica]|uniref:hypothetical protein n=1 Tax=Pseudomonas baltica TaxID=2762576 RepID=UPI00289BB455|nr:hypothetical protein [Pseudomonas baltica]